MKYTTLKLITSLIIFHTCAISPLKSQSINWGDWATHIKKATSSLGSVNISSFDIDSKGDFYAVCSYRMNNFIFGKDTLKYDGSVAEPPVIVKISKTGEILWTKLLSSGSKNAIIKIDKKDVIHYLSQSSLNNYSLLGPYYAQFNSSGNLLIEKEILTADAANIPTSYGNEIMDLLTDENNNYYILHTFTASNGIIKFQDNSSINISQDSIKYPYLILQKFNTENKLIWKKVVRMKNSDASGKIAIDKNKNIIISGAFQKQLLIDNKQLNILDDYTSDIYVVKIDSSGVLKWQKSFGAAGSTDYSNKVFTDKNNNIYLVGTLETGDFSFDSQMLNVAYNDPFALQLDENGLTKRVINIPINRSFSAGRDIQADSLGNIIILGEYRGSGTIGSTTLPNVGDANLSFFISVIDKDNNIKSTLTTAGLNSLQYIKNGKILLKDNKIYMSGNFSIYLKLGNLQLNDVNNTSCLNCYDGFITSINYSLTSKIKETLINSNYLEFYPNPSQGSISIKCTLPTQDNNIEIFIYDTLGRLVKKTKNSTTDLNDITLNDGVYSIYWQSEYFRGSKIIVVQSK